MYSFNDSRLNAEWVGFTLYWYKALFDNTEMLTAARNSLIIALSASLQRDGARHDGRPGDTPVQTKVLPVLVFTPVAMPEILLGVSCLLFFLQVLNLTLGMVSIIIAHTTFCIGFVAIIVRARLQGMDESIIEAARDLRRLAMAGVPPCYVATDHAGGDRRRVDGVYFVHRRLRHHFLYQGRGRTDSAAPDLHDDKDRGNAGSERHLDIIDAAHADHDHHRRQARSERRIRWSWNVA